MSVERLLEREGERAVLAAELDAAVAGSGRLVLVEGEAGLGKSSLLALAGELARDRDVRVLSAVGAVLEQDVAWGVVRQLLEPVVLDGDRGLELLDGPARAAAPVFGVAVEAAEAAFPVDVVPGLEHALYRVVVGLSATTPLLVGVDDVHWSDEASLRWIAYLARRAARLPVVVLAARRVGESSAAAALLEELAAVEGVSRLLPSPLSEDATAVLAGEALRRRGDRGFVRACRDVTGGNPFLLGELLATLAADGAGATVNAEQRVRTLQPERVVAEVARRLGRLSTEAGELARAVALLDGEAELRHAVALAGLPLSAGEAAADELTIARLLRAGRPLRFAHPLLRAAVEAQLPPARRAAAHRLAGALLDAEPTLADRAAAHLLACEPAGDAWVADKLLAAGERATTRGAPEAAVRLLERARGEPCDAPALHLALGRAYRLLGRLEVAAGELAVALAAWPAGAMRVEIARELATTLAMNGANAAALDVLERELAALTPDAPERPQLLAALLGLGMLVDALAIEASARVEREVAAHAGDATGDRLLFGSLALIRARTNAYGAAGAVEAAQRSLAGGHLLADRAPEAFMSAFVALVLLACDRDADAERWFRRTAEEARARGALMTLGIAELGLGRVLRFRGDLPGARAALERAMDQAMLGSSYGRIVTGGTMTSTLVDLGCLEDAEHLLEDIALDAGTLPGLGAATTLLRGRMALHSSRRRHSDALADAAELLDRLERRGHRAPGPLGEVAMVSLAAGERDRARAQAEEELERARRWGTDSALGVAQLQLGQAVEGPAGQQLLERAVLALDRTPCTLELARALLALGAARRRANARAAAREPLRRALDLAARCAAAPLAATARTELAACGARPRRALLSGPASLTPSERRVADLVAHGLSNPEVARTLVVSRATVESHLRAVYRKLDVGSRAELADVLEEP